MAQLKDRYANALLELSQEKNTLEENLNQATLVRDTLEIPDAQAFFVHPHIPDSDKHQFLQKVFPEKLDKHMVGFLYLMIQKNRESLIVPALTEFIARGNRCLGKIEAKVVSAKKLTEKQIESIRTILSKHIHMEVQIEATVDPDVIGGFYILVDGRIFDGTVRSELNAMRERLKRGGYVC